MTSQMDIGFIERTLKTTGILSLIALAFGWMYFPIYDVLSVFSGMIWSMINLYFLALLIINALKTDGIDKGVVIVLAFIKMPLLYVAGYFLIKIPEFGVVPLVIGFSSIFAVMFLKVLGRVLLGLDDKKPVRRPNQQEAN